MLQYIGSHQLELCAMLAGIINIYLCARNNIWNWLFGIITVSLYLIIFYQVKLYADMGLQFIFLLLQFYGIQQWLYGGSNRTALVIRHATLKIFSSAFISASILFCTIAFMLKHYTDSTTVYIDSCTTTLSLIAQWMMGRKWIEHWHVWIITNVISIDMYFYKHLYFTSGLYVIFIILCIHGYRIWHDQIAENETALTHAHNTL